MSIDWEKRKLERAAECDTRSVFLRNLTRSIGYVRVIRVPHSEDCVYDGESDLQLVYDHDSGDFTKIQWAPEKGVFVTHLIAKCKHCPSINRYTYEITSDQLQSPTHER